MYAIKNMNHSRDDKYPWNPAPDPWKKLRDHKVTSGTNLSISAEKSHSEKRHIGIGEVEPCELLQKFCHRLFKAHSDNEYLNELHLVAFG